MHFDDGGDGTGAGRPVGHEPAPPIDGTTVVATEHGSVEFVDSHHDGHPDLMTVFDEEGDVTGRAWLDQSGNWTAADPAAAHGAGGQHDPPGPRPPDIVVDTPDGPRDVGPPTHDTDGDGKPDTAVVTAPDGRMIMYTDRHGDGTADQATEIDPDGQITVQVHEGHGSWATVRRGHLDEHGRYVADPLPAPHDSALPVESRTDAAGWGTGPAHPAVHVDPATGEWVGDPA